MAVYFIQGKRTKLIKIGKSANVVNRLVNLQTGSAELLTCLAVHEEARDDEVYHRRFDKDWVRGEWFKPSQELISFIESLPKTRYTGMTSGFMPNRELTPKQKVCVFTYFETRDADAAILAAYDCQDSSSAERLKYDIFSRPPVLRALSLLLGSNDPEVAKFIQRAEKNERISREQARELKGESPVEVASQSAAEPAATATV